jgi:acyl dehydratase
LAETHDEVLIGEAIEITPRLAMAYSAGLLLDNDRFYGVDGAVPPVLPFLCVRFEWPLALGFRSALGFSGHELARGVHAAQDTEVHRPFRVGERVQTNGVIVQARQTRAGALTVTRYETRSLTAGDVVTTSWSTSILRGVTLRGDPFSRVAPPAAIAPSPGPALVSADQPMPIHLTHAYTECADIWNPIHTEEPAARAAGLPRIIVHGTILWAMAGIALADLKLGGDMDRIARFNGRFVSPVIPGAVMRTVVDGDGPALAWRLEDVASGRVCVAGEAEIR